MARLDSSFVWLCYFCSVSIFMPYYGWHYEFKVAICNWSGSFRYFFREIADVFFYTFNLMYSAFISVELHYSNNFILYPSQEALYMDELFGSVLSYLTSGGLACFMLLRYNDAKRKTETLVKQLEKNCDNRPINRHSSIVDT